MPNPDHYHCPGVHCYWRIQFTTTCSRCGGATVQREDCCDPLVRRQNFLSEIRRDTDDA